MSWITRDLTGRIGYPYLSTHWTACSTRVRTMAKAATRHDSELDLIAEGLHSDPHRVLGRHGSVVRAYRPGAAAMRVVTGSDGNRQPVEMTRVHQAGVFEATVGP